LSWAKDGESAVIFSQPFRRSIQIAVCANAVGVGGFFTIPSWTRDGSRRPQAPAPGFTPAQARAKGLRPLDSFSAALAFTLRALSVKAERKMRVRKLLGSAFTTLRACACMFPL